MGRGGNLLYSNIKNNTYQPKAEPRLYSKIEQRYQPEMIAVESSNIQAIGYDELRRELHISFHPNKQNDLSKSQGYYTNVSKAIFEGMLAASSKGKYMRNVLGPDPQFEWHYFDMSEVEEVIF